MAYTDIDERPFKPAGVALAALLNGAALAGALIFGTTVANIIEDRPLTGFDVDPPEILTPPPPPAKDQPRPEKHDLVIPPVPHDGKGPVSTNLTGEETMVDLGTGTEIAEIQPPALPDPIPEKLTPPPLLKAARIDPRYAANLQPEYPASEIRSETEGVVVVRVLVGTDGRVKAVELIRSPSDGLAEATRNQALRKWRFIPATSDGTAVESWREMTVRFEIPD
jgi:periplasmic protein TonB